MFGQPSLSSEPMKDMIGNRFGIEYQVQKDKEVLIKLKTDDEQKKWRHRSPGETKASKAWVHYLWSIRQSGLPQGTDPTQVS